jgi:hypothetical protein
MKTNFLRPVAAVCVLLAQANLADAQESEIATYRIAAIKWQYAPMAQVAAFYEENRARYAPDSSLRFRLPAQVKSAPDVHTVKLLGPNSSDEIALDESRSFALPKVSGSSANDTAIVVDGYFNKGTYIPIPVVRTATVAPHMLRIGDIRLGCRATVKYIRAYKMSWNLLIGSLKAFSLDICGDKRSDYPVEAPVNFNKVTWMVGNTIVRVQTLPSVQRQFRFPVGDESIADDTLLAFELAPDAVAGEQGSKAGQ